MDLIQRAFLNAKKASRRGDLPTAERWMKIAQRKLAIDEQAAKLIKAKLENAERDVEVKRKTRLEALQRQRYY